MSTENTDQKIATKIEQLTAKDVELTSRSLDIQSNTFVTMADDFPSVFADDAKVLIDPGTRICTFVFFKKHVKPKLKEQRMEYDAIHYEGTLEVKMPFESAFLMVLYMNEVYRKIQAGETGHVRFGPAELV